MWIKGISSLLAIIEAERLRLYQVWGAVLGIFQSVELGRLCKEAWGQNLFSRKIAGTTKIEIFMKKPQEEKRKLKGTTNLNWIDKKQMMETVTWPGQATRPVDNANPYFKKPGKRRKTDRYMKTIVEFCKSQSKGGLDSLVVHRPRGLIDTHFWYWYPFWKSRRGRSNQD